MTDGFETWSANCVIPRHNHRDCYVALVLCGGYEECGSRGRFRVGPGDVLVHNCFDAHLDRFSDKGTKILNLTASGIAAPFGTVDNIDTIVRTAERDPIEAALQLRNGFKVREASPADWPDLLARDLIADPGRSLEQWADAHGLAAETVSRGFRRVFGVTPAFFRKEARARRALTLIAGSPAPLAAIAASAGFADQAHMCRVLRAVTGQPPSAWRRSIPFKTAEAKAD